METIHKSVVMHHCILGRQLSEDELVPDFRYVLIGRTKEGINQYKAISSKCLCKKMVTKMCADEMWKNSYAQQVLKKKDGKIEPVEDMIWCKFWTTAKSKIARIDMIPKADIERAFVDLKKESQILIEEVNLMLLKARAALIVPFRRDPFEGRCLFSFSPDERTPGGHKS